MELMFQPLRRYADFQGRARRAEYWLFQLGLCLFLLAPITIIGIGGETFLRSSFGVALSIAFSIGVFGLLIPAYAVLARRLHDTDRSAWWMLISFLPLLGGLILLALSVLDGTPGRNRFGADPKGRGESDVSVFT